MEYLNEYPPKTIAPVLAKHLKEKFAKYEKKTGSKIVAVVIESTDSPCTIQEYANTLKDKWGLAQDDAADKSIFIVVAAEDEAAHIAIGGGIRHIVPAETVAFILKKFVLKLGFPRNRTQDIDQYRIQDGIDKATYAFYEILSGYKTPTEVQDPSMFTLEYMLTVFAFGIVGLLFSAVIWLIWQGRYGHQLSPEEMEERQKIQFQDIYYWLDKEAREKDAQRQADATDSDKPPKDV